MAKADRTARAPRQRRVAEEQTPRYTEAGDVVVDTNIFIDVLHDHPVWGDWSMSQLTPLVDTGRATIMPIVYAELAAGYTSIEILEAELKPLRLRRENMSWEAAFLAGTAYKLYRKRGGTKRSPLPDFYIGAHATLAGHALLTRDPRRYREYFPRLKVIAPD